MIRYNKDKKQLKKVIEADREAYSNVDSDTREIIDVMTGVRISEENKTMENGEERYNMIKAFEDYKLEGKIEGRIESIMELLEEFGQIPPRIAELIRAEDNLNVLSRWHKAAARATSIADFETNM